MMRRLLSSSFVLAVPLLLVLALPAAGGAVYGQRATNISSSQEAGVALVPPRALVKQAGRVDAFAQDRDSIAWIGRLIDGGKVHVRRLSTGRSQIVGSSRAYRCNLNWKPVMALAGTRALWTSCWQGNSSYVDLNTAALTVSGKPRVVWLDELINGGDSCGRDSYFGAAAGSGTTLVYGWTAVQPVGWNGSCPDVLLLDREVVASQLVPVPQSLPAPAQQPKPPKPIPNAAGPAPLSAVLALAQVGPRSATPLKPLSVSQGRIAVLPAAPVTAGRYGFVLPAPATNGPVAVYDLSGALLSRVFPVGNVREIALSWPTLAVLVQRPGGAAAIELYDARTGALLAMNAVPAMASDLAIGSGATIYRVGKTIYLLRGGRPTVLWRTMATPIGLSLVGRRVAWAVNSPIFHGGRILALTLAR
jgi:hypothetical protein